MPPARPSPNLDPAWFTPGRTGETKPLTLTDGGVCPFDLLLEVPQSYASLALAPGRYRLCRSDLADGTRPRALLLINTTADTPRWQRTNHHVTVDSGTAGFCAERHLTAFFAIPSHDRVTQVLTQCYQEDTPIATLFSISTRRHRVVAVGGTTAYGDGRYPLYRGCDAAGTPIALAILFVP